MRTRLLCFKNLLQDVNNKNMKSICIFYVNKVIIEGMILLSYFVSKEGVSNGHGFCKHY